VANRAHADLMIRLHCDSAAGSGFMTVYPDRQGTVGGVTGPSRKVMRESKIAATALHQTVIAALTGKLKSRGLVPDVRTHIGSKQGALTGSIHSKIPVVLVEMAVLNNAHDDAFIASKSGQTDLAKALADGVASALLALGKNTPVRAERR
jgi:N-acetylmuramoyl-L-alanine amidase